MKHNEEDVLVQAGVKESVNAKEEIEIIFKPNK